MGVNETATAAASPGARWFVRIARASARLPDVRGRTRPFLELYRLLGLGGKSVVVRVRLRRPTPFDARLDLRSWLQRVAFLTGGYESDTTEFLLKLRDACRPDGYLLDVGANVGLLALPFALLAGKKGPPDLRVVAVEAVPDNHRALVENIALNGLETAILPLNVALGDTAKIAEIQVEGDLRAGEGSGTANILAEGSDHPCVRQEVSVVPLDRLWRESLVPTRCAVVKIDTDGYDLKVLQGAVEFLAAERPVVFGEFSRHCLRWHGQTVDDVLDLASRLRYRVWQRLPKSWRFREAIRRETYEEDLLLVPGERERAFSWCLHPEFRALGGTPSAPFAPPPKDMS